MTRRIKALTRVLALSALALSALLITGLWGCGDTSVCEEACEKQKSCARALDCTTTDPLGAGSCQQQKDQLLAADCSKLSIEGACEGDIKALYESIDQCTLNPTTCTCGN